MMRRKNQPMAISEAELLAMTRDMEEMHQATLPKMHDAIAGLRDGRPSRRGFLFGAAGVTAGAVLLAACGGDSKSSTTPTTGAGASSTASSGGAALTGDLAVTALAASLENLAVQTYQAAIDAATAGKLGTVPPAIVTFAKTAQSQHKDHADAWNAILTYAGKPKVTGIDKTVQDTVVTPGFAKVTDVPSLGRFALGLEDAAAATYLNAIQNALTDKSTIQTAATIQPVEMQHSAILHFVLGEYPIPASFASTDGARPLTDVIA
jgi:Ferritin-like domain